MVDRPTPFEEFHARVEAYLKRTGMAAARFGLLACGDQNFVFDLREGRRDPRLSTVEKIDGFMRTHRTPDGMAEEGRPCAADP
jgi:hypothetical protein